MVRNTVRSAAVVAVLAGLALAPGCARRKVYENPISKDTQQPDKVLFDRAVDDIEHGRYERGRLTLQTLMNTYDTSEYLAKAKLAYADSWYREGGAHGFAQAEAEYKDFILFYPQMEEAAEAQDKICTMQYRQMDKADRDPAHTRRAEEECRQVLIQFPNSKFAPQAKQYLLEVQEVLADGEYRVGTFYHDAKGSYPAAANRLQAVADQYPLYSRADDNLMELADSYHRMGDNFENQEVAAYSKLVNQYPLSPRVKEASGRLKAMGRPVPEADPVAYAREKYEQENRRSRGVLSKVWGPFGEHPNTLTAAQSGSPGMETFKPTVPASVPVTPAGETNGTTGVSVGGDSGVTTTLVRDTSLIDSAPDARANRSGAAAGTAAPGSSTAAPTGAAAASGTTPTGSAAASSGTTPAGSSAPQQAPPKPANASLPQNHTGNRKVLTPAQQLKLTEKQQAQFKKQQALKAKTQKKQEEDQAKKDKKKKKDDTVPAAAQTSGTVSAPAAKPE
jgi:outer membrane protein assembly factor BamD